MEKWALALEGGSLRCMFSAGAVDVMMEHHLWADGVFGVSAGALTGVNYVSRQTGRTAQVNLDFVGDKRYLGLGNLIFKRSIFNFDFLFGEISDKLIPLDRKTFAQSDMEFTAVTTDCRTGQPAFWEKHACQDIYGAIRASASMPLLSPIVPWRASPVWTAVCLCPSPIKSPWRMVIPKWWLSPPGSTATASPHPQSPGHSVCKYYKRYPSLVRSLLETPRRYARELDELDHLEAQGKVFVLRPPEPVTVSRTEKDVTSCGPCTPERQVCQERMEELEHYLNS